MLDGRRRSSPSAELRTPHGGCNTPARLHALESPESSRRATGEGHLRLPVPVRARLDRRRRSGSCSRCSFPALEFFGEVSPVEFFTGTNWAPLFEPPRSASSRCSAGTFVVTLLGAPRRDPARPRLGDLPQRVRVAASDEELPQADPRDPRRHPDRRLRLLRPDGRDAAAPRRWGSRSQIFNVLAGGLVHGRHAHPDDRLALRGRDVGRAPGPSRRGVRPRRRPSCRSRHASSSRRRSRGSSPSFVLGVSRAVGETMIVLIAVGQHAQAHVQSRWRPMQTLTAFIGATGNGDLPTGSIEYKTIFAVGLTPVRDDARDEHHLDQARAQVPRGLRLRTLARQKDASVTPPVSLTSRRGRWHRTRDGAFRGAVTGSVLVGLAVLVAFIVEILVEGWPKLNWDSSRTSPRASRRRPAPVGHLRDLLHGGHRARRRGPHRCRDGRLHRAVRRHGALVQPAARGQHPEPRGRAVHRVRHPRAGVPGARLPGPGSGRAHRGPHPHARRPADRDHLVARGDPRGPESILDGALALGATRWQGSGGRSCRPRSRASPRARFSPCHARSARRRHCC